MMSGGEGGQDFDINLAPIIDCFTVLITYLLVSASFISLSAIDVGVAAVGPAAPGAPPKEPPVSMTLTLRVGGGMELKLSGGKNNVNQTIPVAAAGGTWDLSTMTARVINAAKQYPSIEEANVTAEPTVVYKDVVSVIETLRKSIKKVFLAAG